MIVPRPQISRGGPSARTRRHGRGKGTARATGAFEGPPPEECAVKQARSEVGVGTAHPEECGLKQARSEVGVGSACRFVNHLGHDRKKELLLGEATSKDA